MKKIIAINGSPRKKGNTAEVLTNALKGAQDAGAETELIHLADLDFSGCKSCFACKPKGGKSYGKCALNDDLTPVLEKILACDGLLVGSPVYFGGETGLCRNFIERLFFPVLRYDPEYTSLAPKTVPLAFVYTMNVPEDRLAEFHYPEHLGVVPGFGARLLKNSSPEVLYVCDTFQFDDYGKYDAPLFDAEHKKSVRATRFPEDCRKAIELGRKLVTAD